jgi:betaine-aldehyde dehydrogenase
MLEYKLYINGQFKDASDKGTMDAVNPYDRSVFAKLAKATVTDTKSAIQAARNAFDSGVWSDKPREERSAVIKQIADKIKENYVILQELEIKESGSTYKKSKDERFLTCRSINFF